MTAGGSALETVEEIHSCEQPSTACGEKSFSKVLQEGRVIDPHRYRVLFPERWSAFLRAHHRTIEEVAVFYDVTYRCARNWWEGSHRPSGDKVAIAAVEHPTGFHKYMGSTT